jgi:signal transduction histidine kinase
VRLEIESRPCAGRLALHAEDLLRILFNLVANAVEALASLPVELGRQPLLRITAQRGGAASFLPGHKQSGVQTVLLSVRDNGPGIDARHLPHIFDAGFSTRRGDEDESPRGLGLAIVRRLVGGAGGAVRAVSPSGLGTRFDIELPVLPLERQPGAGPIGLELAASPVEKKIPDSQQISAQIEKEA